MAELKSIKERASRIGFPHRVWGRLASTPQSIIYPQNISNWLAGDVTSRDKQDRLMAVLESVEDLVTSTVVKVDLTDAANVRAAIARLAEIRRNPATAPYVGRAAATATYDATHTSSASASAILATPLDK